LYVCTVQIKGQDPLQLKGTEEEPVSYNQEYFYDFT
jgi:hypothetical protein